MRAITEQRAIELRWNEVRDILSEEIKKILGLHTPCRISLTGTEFWAVTFKDYGISLPKFCQILQAIQATPDDWEEALLGDNCADALGMTQAEKLIGRNLKITWQHRLITENSLWLVGVADSAEAGPEIP